MTRQTGDKAEKSAFAATVIVPTYRRTRLLCDALASILAQRSRWGFEVVVVDNGASREVRQYVEVLARTAAVPLRYVAERRLGLHHARHAGARAARGRILVYIDDDVLAPQGWLEAMCARYVQPGVACVGGKTISKWEAVPPKWIVPLIGPHIGILDLGQEARDMSPGESPYGCNFSVLRDVLFEVGGFNPDYYGPVDSPDSRAMVYLSGDGECGLVAKLFERGYRVLYEPRAWLYHRVCASRMTRRYFYRRSFVGGIECGYRRFRSQPVAVWRLLLRAEWNTTLCLYHAVRSLWKRPGTAEYVRARIGLSYRKGGALHALRLCWSGVLREHVTKDRYLD